MASRKLGGGRVLGSGKGLQPPPPPPTAAAASPSVQRATSYYAQSDSTASMGSIGDSLASPASGSPGSMSPLPDFPQDLTSRVSLAGPSAGASNGSKLVCPICEEEMVCAVAQISKTTYPAGGQIAEKDVVVDAPPTESPYRRQPSRIARIPTRRSEDVV